MTLEEIKAKKDITVEELEEQIQHRQEWLFYANMAENYDSKLIQETRNVLRELEGMLMELQNKEGRG